MGLLSNASGYGFTSVNNSGQVLISSDTKNLHFVGKATYIAGSLTAGYGGYRLFKYSITLPEYSIIVPFYTQPTTDYYAFSKMTASAGNVWNIEIIASGTSTVAPEVYCFSELTTSMLNTATDSWGFRVYNDTAGVTYDSRFKPLVVLGGASTTSPTRAISDSPPWGTGWADPLYAEYCHGVPYQSGLMTPDQTTNITSTLSATISKPIIQYQTIAQTQRQWTAYRERTDNYFIYSEFRTWTSVYWAFYRAGISVSTSNTTATITSGWININHNCYHSSTKDGSLLGFIDVGDSSSSGGIWPFSNSTINNKTIPIIISDGALYD